MNLLIFYEFLCFYQTIEIDIEIEIEFKQSEDRKPISSLINFALIDHTNSILILILISISLWSDTGITQII